MSPQSNVGWGIDPQQQLTNEEFFFQLCLLHLTSQPLTQDDIARGLGVSRQCVADNETKALSKLKAMMRDARNEQMGIIKPRSKPIEPKTTEPLLSPKQAARLLAVKLIKDGKNDGVVLRETGLSHRTIWTIKQELGLTQKRGR